MDSIVNIPVRSNTRRSPSPELLALLESRFAERFSTSKSVLLQHGTDESIYPPRPPDAVVYVRSTEEAAFVVRACARSGCRS